MAAESSPKVGRLAASSQSLLKNPVLDPHKRLRAEAGARYL
jgi:hypothetical protein